MVNVFSHVLCDESSGLCVVARHSANVCFLVIFGLGNWSLSCFHVSLL